MLNHTLKRSLILGFTFIFTFALLTTAASAQFWSQKERQLLPEEEAFQVSAYVNDAGILKVNWTIAQDYYMYRDQFRIEATNPDITIEMLKFPEGEIEDDPEFGEVVVYFYNAELSARVVKNSLSNEDKDSTMRLPVKVDLILKGQGCNKPVGVCYPPMIRNVSLETTPLASLTASQYDAPPSSKSFLAYMASALLAGLLLSFTPCVLPMIPILAGVIAGQKNPSKLRSGWLAICYVLGTIVTYMIAGALAGATGAQLQAYFQNVWVISSISALLVLLAGSLFGWFKIQMPSSIQSKLSTTNVEGKSASWSSFVLGLISALVVGACVSPILIVTLGAAITQGDPVLGAAIMGSMAVGMGTLLVLFGFGAGWILPKAGGWMNQVQVIFGFMVLGVAIYLLSALPFIPSLYLWAALLLCTGFYVWGLASEINSGTPNSLTSSALRTIGAITILWGAMALVGGTLKGNDILRPLGSLTFNSGSTAASSRADLPFQRTSKLADVKTFLEDAKQAGKPALIDFYADWCLDCKRMHRTTFKEASVRDALSGWALIEIDVTDTSDMTDEAKRYFGVFGPPATLFFASNGQEKKELRQYGYLDENSFIELVKKSVQ
jgi:thiol:disulfide interchange protein DsbD